MQQRYEHNTQKVTINLSNRVQGVMPYIFLPDNTLVGLHFKGSKVFRDGVNVYWLTAEQAHKVAQVQLNIQEIIVHLKKQIDLTEQQLRAVAYQLATRNK